ncbi:MAG TPA: hypothetical protein DCF88_08195 [Plesiomonas shigelloides]|nr:hypothetical protein [Plesiomonas shigelloides]
MLNVLRHCSVIAGKQTLKFHRLRATTNTIVENHDIIPFIKYVRQGYFFTEIEIGLMLKSFI